MFTVATDGYLAVGLYTVPDLADELHKHPVTIQLWCAQLNITPYRLRSGTRLFTEEMAVQLREYADTHPRGWEKRKPGDGYR